MNLKKIPEYLAFLSLIYSNLELARYIVSYIYIMRVPLPSLFHLELLVVLYAPAYFIWKGLSTRVKKRR